MKWIAGTLTGLIAAFFGWSLLISAVRQCRTVMGEGVPMEVCRDFPLFYLVVGVIGLVVGFALGFGVCLLVWQGVALRVQARQARKPAKP